MFRVKLKTATLWDFYLYVNIYKRFEKVIDWFSRFMNMMHPCCFLTGINCIFKKILNRLDDYILCKYHLKRIKMTKISEWLKLNFLEYHIETFNLSLRIYFSKLIIYVIVKSRLQFIVQIFHFVYPILSVVTFSKHFSRYLLRTANRCNLYTWSV